MKRLLPYQAAMLRFVGSVRYALPAWFRVLATLRQSPFLQQISSSPNAIRERTLVFFISPSSSSCLFSRSPPSQKLHSLSPPHSDPDPRPNFVGSTLLHHGVLSIYLLPENAASADFRSASVGTPHPDCVSHRPSSPASPVSPLCLFLLLFLSCLA